MAALSKVIVIIILILGSGASQSLPEGNAAKETPSLGLDTYRSALKKRPGLPEAHFGAGWEVYQSQDFAQAANEFESVLRTGNPDLRSKALYNIGNARFKQGDFRQSLEAYRRSLELNPGDEDAKYNYELTLRRLRQPEEENQSMPQGNANKEEQPHESDKSDPSDPSDESDLSDLDGNVNAILNALEAKEHNLMRRRWKQPGSVTLEKDW